MSKCYEEHATHASTMANRIHGGGSRAPADADGRGVSIAYGEVHGGAFTALDTFEAGVKAVREHYRGRIRGAVTEQLRELRADADWHRAQRAEKSEAHARAETLLGQLRAEAEDA